MKKYYANPASTVDLIVPYDATKVKIFRELLNNLAFDNSRILNDYFNVSRNGK